MENRKALNDSKGSETKKGEQRLGSQTTGMDDLGVGSGWMDKKSTPEKRSTPPQTTEERVVVAESAKDKLVKRFGVGDFIVGKPEFKLRFTEVIRKFNKELMKSTCQVMKGCKSQKAK